MKNKFTKWGDKPYHSLDYYLKNTYGEKIYKIALDAGMTCPNRDGTLDTRGCIFCSAGGSGDFASHGASIREQLENGKKLFRHKKIGSRFIAYFQSFTNTYAEPERLKRLFEEALSESDVVGISIATRPDCISDNMLTRMRRNVSKSETYDLIEKFRQEVPGIHLRTTLMVGFPGETEEDFEELKEFVQKARFDRMGAFAYSEEEGTYAAETYEDSIPQEVKQARLDELMALQQEISADLSHNKIGQEFKVIIDRKEGEYYIGRTQFDSPEVDPEVLIKADGKRLFSGRFYQVRITNADDFDLFGEII